MAENNRTFCGPRTFLDGIDEAGIMDDLVAGADVDILSERNVLSRQAHELDRIVKLVGLVEVGTLSSRSGEITSLELPT